ncbi:S8 family serine peptidase [bacterium]|nr:S8 family serine peptidase [bacterium]
MSFNKGCLFLFVAVVSFSYAQNSVTIRTGSQSFAADLPDHGRVVLSPDQGIVHTESLQPDDNVRIIVQFEAAPILSNPKSRSLNKVSTAHQIQLQRARFESEMQHVYLQSVQNNTGYNLSSPRIIHAYRHCFNGLALTVPQCMIRPLRDLSSVKKVYVDQEVHSSLDDSVPLIGADSVWKAPGYTGKDILVGIIDTGIDYTHPALGGGFGSGYKVMGGYDIYNHDADPMDDNGHGTHVAGIVAGNSDRVRGVAPDARLMSFKVLNQNGSGWMSDVLRGIELAVDPDDDPFTDDGVDVINMSLGHASRNPEDPDCQAVNTAVQAGVVCVVAAGNEGFDGYETIGSPALANSAVTVGAVDKEKRLAEFSSMGPAGVNEMIKPDLVAPGVDIYSSELGWSTFTHTGTSMAAPHVAGMAALLCEKYPQATPEQIKGLLCGSAEDLGMNFFQQGSGMVHAIRAARLSTSIQPSNLGLGVVDANQDLFTARKYLSIMNLSAQSQSYELSLRHSLPSGATINLDRADIELGPNSQDSVLVTMTVDTRIALQFDDYPGSFEGWVDVASDQDTLGVPFSLLHVPSIQLHFESKYCHLTLYKETGDSVESDPKWYFNLESPCNLLVPSGDYNIKAEIYENKKEYQIFKKIHFDKSMELHFSVSEAPYALSAYIHPDLQEKIKNCYWRRYLVDKKTGWSTITFHFGNSRLDTIYVSSFDTARFSLGWIQYAQDINDRVYLASDGINEPLTESRVLQINPSGMMPIDFSVNVNPFLTEDLYRLGFESIAWDGRFSTSFNNEHALPLDEEGRFYLYVTPEDETPFFYYKFSFFKQGLFDVIEDTYWKSGYLCFHNDRITASFSEYEEDDSEWGFHEKLIETKSFYIPEEAVYFGMAIPPAYPRRSIQVASDQVKIPLNNFYFQAGDYLTSVNDRETEYRIYLENALVAEGATQDSVIALSGDGPYRLELLYPGIAAFGKYTGDASVTAEFNTKNEDMNPPQLMDIQLFSDGFLMDPFAIPGRVTLSAWLQDDTDLAEVDIQYRTSGENVWHDLQPVRDNDCFTADLPDTLVKTWIDLRISAEDISGNRFKYSLLPAYINQGITYVSHFKISPDYIRPNQEIAISAKVTDVDGVQKVEASIKDTTGSLVGKIRLFDDGNHHDGKAEDHLYAAQWTTPTEGMDFMIELAVSDQAGHVLILPSMINATTHDMPCLSLTESRIERQPADSVGVIEIQNTGLDTARQVMVQLFEYGFDFVLYEETIESIDPGGRFQWMVPLVIERWIESGEEVLVPVTMQTSKSTWHDTLTIDITGNAGPDISGQKVYPKNAEPGGSVHLECTLIDDDGILSLKAYMYDDGNKQIVDSLMFNRGEECEWCGTEFFAECVLPDTESDFHLVIQAQDSLGNVSFDSTSLKFTTCPVPDGSGDVLVLGQFRGTDDQALRSITDALSSNDISWELWNRTYRGFCDYMLLNRYLKKIVIWHPDVYRPTEEEIEFGDKQPDEEERYKIKRYLDQGGNLIVTQSDFVENVGDYDKKYETVYLYYRKQETPRMTDHIQGLEEDPIGHGLVLNLKSGTSMNAMKPRRTKYGSVILQTDNGDQVALRVSKEDYHAVVLGFDFKNIAEEESRNILMHRIVQWLRSPSTSVEEMLASELPAAYEMGANYPNPFNGQTVIPFQLPEAGRVTIQIYDLLGRRVAVLLDDRELNAGYHLVNWDGLNQAGMTVSSGVYFGCFEADDYRSVRKMVYIR